jgi:hypothetical protein
MGKTAPSRMQSGNFPLKTIARILVMRERTKLLPKWIYAFSWFFLLFLGTPLVFIIGIYLGYAEFSMYGIKFKGSVFHPISILLIMLGTFKGIVAYGLLWGKRWGAYAGIIFGIIAIACSLGSTIFWSFKENFYFDFSFIFLLIFLMELIDIRKSWVEIKN